MITTFAAIDVGSYELTMKIFEMSSRTGIREIDHIRRRVDLGTQTFASGKMAYQSVDELCQYLKEFTKIMKGYRVSDYKAYGTSAVRETENMAIVLDQVRQRTGIAIEVLSNSEQRFLDYKSIAFRGEVFNKIIEKGTAIVDIGGGSIQLSLFDKDALVATQNLKLGVLRLRDYLNHLDIGRSKYENLLQELVESQLAVFKKLYLKDRKIHNIIVVDEYISALVQRKLVDHGTEDYVKTASFKEFLDKMRSKTEQELTKKFDMPEESVTLLQISASLLEQIVKMMNAEMLWVPGVSLCDGMAYEYAEKNKMIMPEHHFEEDIIACAKNISKRYMGSRKRGETLEKIALTIFDSMKRIHGLDKRERLLLQIATLLHDCGKYISMVNLGECSYSIIMATEIIGLSHSEREMVANVVKYNHLEFDYYEELGKRTALDMEAYIKIAKLTAILRIANGLDRSHKQKFRDVRTLLRDNILTITVDTNEDITLEKGLFGNRADFFEEVFSVKPVIRQKRTF